MVYSQEHIRGAAMLPNSIPEDKIIALEKEERKRYEKTKSVDEYRKRLAARRERQDAWLGTFEMTLSPRLACEKNGIPYSNYSNWRRDPEFCKRFNKALESVREEMYGVAIGRAIGYRPIDDEGNPMTDGDGKPVYQGGSDRLMMAFLGMTEKSAGADLTVNIEIVSKENRVYSDIETSTETGI